MFPMILSRMRRTVDFKKALGVGDIIITNITGYPAYCMVWDLRANDETEAPGEWWDIDLIFLFIPPVKHTVTVSTRQLTGEDKLLFDDTECFLVPLDLTSIGEQRKPLLKLIKSHT